jgi:hypothetical protein
VEKVIASKSYCFGHEVAIIAAFNYRMVTFQPLSLPKDIALAAQQKR